MDVAPRRLSMSTDCVEARTTRRPALFVGSSVEGLKIAQTVQVLLDRVCEVTLWPQGPISPSKGTLESLEEAAPQFDFAVFVLGADDKRSSRGVAAATARDNVLLELGIFIGVLGRERVFILLDRADPPTLPTDLAGYNPVTYELHPTENLLSALGAACTIIGNIVASALELRGGGSAVERRRPGGDLGS
jgi:predicted nucleotide-binding protein